MEIKASGSVTAVIKLNVLLMKTGKDKLALEKKSPETHPITSGFDNRALNRKAIFSLKQISLSEYQIRVDTASTLITGMTTPTRTPKCRTP